MEPLLASPVENPASHAGGAPPWVFAALAVLACVGLVALLIAG
jgi:hypothetical protein